MKVFLLQHVHRLGDSENPVEDVKIIGIYSTEENACKARDRLRTKPGFSSDVDAFFIDQYELDEDHWLGGYSVAG